jgi:hypothetical protein
MCRCTRTFNPAGTAEGCPGLRRGLFPAVPTGLGRASDPTQDAVLGLHAALKSPAGTTEQVSLRHGPQFGQRIEDSEIADMLRWKCSEIASG